MKKYIYSFFSMLFLFTLNVAEAQQDKKSPPKAISFFQGSHQDFETKLLNEGKPGFVFLYSNGQRESMALSRMMEQQMVINYVDSNFLAYKAEVEAYPQLALQYGIENVPCVILIGTSQENAPGFIVIVHRRISGNFSTRFLSNFHQKGNFVDFLSYKVPIFNNSVSYSIVV